MALSRPKDKQQLFDPYRNSWVVATPEELVRQKLLKVMTEKLGYPRELIAIEKQLSELPHVDKAAPLPKRRADILCFSRNIHRGHPLYPLLLIECKEGEGEEGAAAQALGYNHYVQALYVAVAAENRVELIYPHSLSFLPTYQELLENLCP